MRIEQSDGYRGRLPVRQHFHQPPLPQVVSNDILRQLRQPKSCQAHFYIKPRFIHRGGAADGYRKSLAVAKEADPKAKNTPEYWEADYEDRAKKGEIDAPKDEAKRAAHKRHYVESSLAIPALLK